MSPASYIRGRRLAYVATLGCLAPFRLPEADVTYATPTDERAGRYPPPPDFAAPGAIDSTIRGRLTRYP